MTNAGKMSCAGLAMLGLALAGCTVSQVAPPPPRPFGQVESEERGVIVSVNDTMIDRRTGRGPDARVRTPHIPVGPMAVSVPVTIGGEKRMDAPAEEITVRLAGNKTVQIVQERGSPPFAEGERVLVQREKPSELTGESRTRVVRDEDYSPARVNR